MTKPVAKRQHYIWKKYLAQWTDNKTTEGKMFIFLKQENKIIESSLHNLAVESYFYDMSSLSDDDFSFIISSLSSFLEANNLQNLNINLKEEVKLHTSKDYFEVNVVCEMENKGHKFLEALYLEKFPFTNRSAGSEYILHLRKNTVRTLLQMNPVEVPEEFREVHKIIEGLSLEEMELVKKLIQYRNLNQKYNGIVPRKIEKAVDLLMKITQKEDERFDFFEFIAFQMFRTKREKKNIESFVEKVKSRVPNKNITEALFPLWVSISSLFIANQLEQGDYFVEILINETKIDYLTSDEPVINLCSGYSKERNFNELTLYYSITPKIAISCSNKQKTNTRSKIYDEAKIDELNRFVFNAAYNQVYSHDKKTLERYARKGTLK